MLVNREELRYMAEYTWVTLLALCERLQLKQNLRFRVLSDFIEVPRELSDVIKISALLLSLLESTRKILRRIQHTLVEELRVTKHEIKGKIDTHLIALFYPHAIPTRFQRISIQTPANLLLIITVLDIIESLQRSLKIISSYKTKSYFLQPLISQIKKELSKSISLCMYLLLDPVLRPLLPLARLIKAKIGDIKHLERTVLLESFRKPKEYIVYRDFLRIRRCLKQTLSLTNKTLRQEGFKKLLTIEISPGKLYELFGFTLVMESLCKVLKIDENWKINIDRKGRFLVMENQREDISICISFNALPRDIKSRLQKARAYGIINGPINVESLRGLPDTIILLNEKGNKRKVIIDYKYSRDLSYLVNARFKALAYMFEFKADAVIIISPMPIKFASILDEEVVDQRSFYIEATRYGGAFITINENGILILTFIEPEKSSLSYNKQVLETVFSLVRAVSN